MDKLFAIALTYDNRIQGYYRADDENITGYSLRARRYETQADAEADLELIQDTWFLMPGESWDVVEFESVPEDDGIGFLVLKDGQFSWE